MGTRTKIKKLITAGTKDQQLTVCGWIKSKRVSKNFAFLVINDGSTQSDLQIIVDSDQPVFALLSECHTGGAVRMEGTLKESPGKGQKWELHASQGEIIGEADPERYPLQKKGHTLEFLREIGHLRGRTNTFGAVFRVRNCLAQAVHDFFQQRDFLWIHTPIITGSDCEGAGELFQVTTLDLNNVPRTEDGKVDYRQDFFAKPAYLTVSGQLQGESAALAFGDIYTFGPTFRAENSNTSRHLAEFWMVEPEMAFANLNDDMSLAEDFLRHCFKRVVTDCEAELAFLEKHYKNTTISSLNELAEASFHRCSYGDAIDQLIKSGKKFEFPVSWGLDLQSEHERFLTENIFKGPVTVFDYPRDIKAFYMRQNDDGKTVAAMDVLMPRVGELIGGSQREDRPDQLREAMLKHEIDPSQMPWYLELREFGGTPHAGFGLGFERLVQYVTGMSNIRDVIAFPRAPQTIDF